MTQAIRVKDVEVGDFILSVTTRMNDTDDGQVLEELTERTITAWLFIVDAVTTNKWVYSPDLGSVEERFCAEHNITLEETFGDSRVTVWDTWRSKRRVGFHLNSNDKPQRALQVRDANESGSNKAVAKWNATHPNTSQQTDAPATPKNAPQQPPAPSAPTAPQNAANANVGSFYTKNEAIEKLAVGTVFNMKICQIKLRSKDDQHYYELYAKYGQNVGKYPEISLYTDNEVALKNGLIADLDKFGLKPGESKLGEWVLSCNVGKPKVDGDKTYGRVYADSFVSS